MFSKLCFFFIIGLCFEVLAVSNEGNCSSGDSNSIISLTICLDDDLKELEQLRARIEQNVLNRIDVRYGKKDATRAKHLKLRFENSTRVWYQYRYSYCEMESISVNIEDNQAEFVKQCLVSLSRSRIEDLRLMQISI